MLFDVKCLAPECGNTDEILAPSHMKDEPYECSKCGGETKRVELYALNFEIPGFKNGQNVTLS